MNDNPNVAEYLCYRFGRLEQLLSDKGVEVMVGDHVTQDPEGGKVPSIYVTGRYRGTRFVAEVAFCWLGKTDVQIEHRKLEALRTIKVQLDKVRRMNDQECGGR